MNALKPILLFSIVAAITISGWYFFFPPPEKAIKNQLGKLASAVSARPEGNIAKVSNASKIGSFFHPEVSIRVEGFGREFSSVQGRAELEQMAMAARQNVRSVSVQFYNIHVQVAPEKTSATAVLTALVSINDQADPFVQDLRLTLEKEGRKWLIRTVVPTKGLKPE